MPSRSPFFVNPPWASAQAFAGALASDKPATICTRLAFMMTLVGLMAGCQLAPRALSGDNLQRIENELESLEALVIETQTELEALNNQSSAQLEDVTTRLGTIDRGVKRVPRLITSACTHPETTKASCDDMPVQTVITTDDKMLVGRAEHLWVDPPGLSLTAIIDTSVASNEIHATQVTPFERDGEDWVRFNLSPQKEPTKDNGGRSASAPKSVVVEKKIIRLLSVSKRPVVRLRVKLGNVLGSFDFVLDDRSDTNHWARLGRNFLQDIALVDVGKEFVQPRFDNSNRESELGSNTPDG